MTDQAADAAGSDGKRGSGVQAVTEDAGAAGGDADPSLVDQASGAADDADEAGGADAADAAEAADEQQEPEADPLDLPPTERPLLPEEQAWMRDTNRIRKARRLPLVDASKIPGPITARAVQRAKARR